MYYAEHCPYGVNTISDCNQCLRFETKRERDEFVHRGNKLAAHDEYMELTLAEAKAFRYDMKGFDPDHVFKFGAYKTCNGKFIECVGKKS